MEIRRWGVKKPAAFKWNLKFMRFTVYSPTLFTFPIHHPMPQGLNVT